MILNINKQAWMNQRNHRSALLIDPVSDLSVSMVMMNPSPPQVYPDFSYYKEGIYHHTGLLDATGPFELTNHAVLLVGYGRCAKCGQNYWVVKNSWGDGWGEKGFFRIRRGSDECAIESIAVAATPIPSL